MKKRLLDGLGLFAIFLSAFILCFSNPHPVEASIQPQGVVVPAKVVRISDGRVYYRYRDLDGRKKTVSVSIEAFGDTKVVPMKTTLQVSL